MQFLLGSGFLLLSAFVHVAFVAACISHFRSLAGRTGWTLSFGKKLRVLSTGVLVVLAAHTAHIWMWAAALLAFGHMDGFGEAFYFSTTTYTTLGYGDIILGPEGRIFASFAAVTGMLTFGISAAFLVSIMTRLLSGDPRFPKN